MQTEVITSTGYANCTYDKINESEKIILYCIVWMDPSFLQLVQVAFRVQQRFLFAVEVSKSCKARNLTSRSSI